MARLSDKFKELSDLYDKESGEYEKLQYEQVKCPVWNVYHCSELCGKQKGCKIIVELEKCRTMMKDIRGQIDYYSFMNIGMIITALRFFEKDIDKYRKEKEDGI